jgi:hypothetical protein
VASSPEGRLRASQKASTLKRISRGFTKHA